LKKKVKVKIQNEGQFTKRSKRNTAMFSTKKKNTQAPLISPRKVVAPRTFSHLIQQPASSLSASSSSPASPIPARSVPTLDIIAPGQKELVSQLSKPKVSPVRSTVVSQRVTPVKKKRVPKAEDVDRKRLSVETLEDELANQTKVLVKLQSELEQSQKIYSKTREQLELKQEENNQTAKLLITSLIEMRKSLNNLNAT
jgi:uncharacterized coiled-coil protein SlyX